MTVRLTAMILAVIMITGCGTVRDRRDAPWDPKHPQQMLEQIPAWPGHALAVCCGSEPVCKPGQSPRC